MAQTSFYAANLSCFSVIHPLPVSGVTVRSLETEDIVTFGIAGVVIFVDAFAMISRLGRSIQSCLGVVIGYVRYEPQIMFFGGEAISWCVAKIDY